MAIYKYEKTANRDLGELILDGQGRALISVPITQTLSDASPPEGASAPVAGELQWRVSWEGVTLVVS